MGSTLDRIAEYFGYYKPKKRRISVRNYAAASTDRLFSAWTTAATSADTEIRNSLRALRARSRQLERDDPYFRRFIQLSAINSIGPNGIGFQSKVRMRSDPNRLDDRMNNAIESAWRSWGKRGICSADGVSTWADLEWIAAKTVARDGELLVRKVRGYRNGFNFALQFLEADQLDEEFNTVLSNGNRVIMGVEVDAFSRPVGYHLLQVHPGDDRATALQAQRRIRIPASDMIHVFVKDRPSQTRGVPWFHASMTRLNQLQGYEEAELVAARVAASKMGFFITPDGQQYTGDDVEDGTGAKITDAEPGTFEELPEGQDFKPWDPSHPAGNFEPFLKSVLRGIASGGNRSYTSISSDLTDVNFSSMRAGTLAERDNYRMEQSFFVHHFHQPVMDDWLPAAIMSGKIPGDIIEETRLNAAKWQPRGWDWVDPLKDVQASIQAIGSGLSTLTRELGKQGTDLEEIVEEVLREQAILEKAGITFAPAKASTPPADSSEEGEKEG